MLYGNRITTLLTKDLEFPFIGDILMLFFFVFGFWQITMSNDVNQYADVLNQLKSGFNLVKQKFNGKKFPRRFYLHEREGYISYHQSRKLFGRPRMCKLIQLNFQDWCSSIEFRSCQRHRWNSTRHPWTKIRSIASKTCDQWYGRMNSFVIALFGLMNI